HLRTALTLHLRVLQIAADGDLPGNVDERARPAEETPGESRRARREALAQNQRFDAGDRHALTVDGIEAAKRVTARQEPVRKPRQVFVVAAQVGAELIGDDRRKRLGVPDRLEYLGRRQGAGEFQKAGLVRRHLLTEIAAQADRPALALLREQRAETPIRMA